MRKLFIILSVLGALQLTACTTTGASDDPWAGYNHRAFESNKALDQAIFEPVSRSYRAVAPEPARDGLHNALANLRAPTDVLNNALQGKPEGVIDTVGRFIINSTLGIGGLFDPATDMGIASHNEDFGQTLAVWGVEPGPYLVLPFFGPSNPRDAIGIGVDIVTHPVSFLRYEHSTAVGLSRFGLTALDGRTGALDLVDSLRETSVDEYAAFRSLYEQSRSNAIRDGAFDIDEIPDFDEFEDEEDDYAE